MTLFVSNYVYHTQNTVTRVPNCKLFESDAKERARARARLVILQKHRAKNLFINIAEICISSVLKFQTQKMVQVFIPAQTYLNVCNHRFPIASPKMQHVFKHENENENEINVIHALPYIEKYTAIFLFCKLHLSKFM